MTKAEITKQILEDNYTMINSLLTKEEKKHFEDGDFTAYLIKLCNEKLSKQ